MVISTVSKSSSADGKVAIVAGELGIHLVLIIITVVFSWATFGLMLMYHIPGADASPEKAWGLWVWLTGSIVATIGAAGAHVGNCVQMAESSQY